jgi:hypothetical protein
MLARGAREKAFDHASPALRFGIDAKLVDVLRQIRQHRQVHQHLLVASVLCFKTGRWGVGGCTHDFSGSRNCEYRMVAERAPLSKTILRANPSYSVAYVLLVSIAEAD